MPKVGDLIGTSLSIENVVQTQLPASYLFASHEPAVVDANPPYSPILTVTTSSVTEGVWVKLTGFTLKRSSNASLSSNNLVAGTKGIFLVRINITLRRASGSGTRCFSLGIAKNQTASTLSSSILAPVSGTTDTATRF